LASRSLFMVAVFGHLIAQRKFCSFLVCNIGRLGCHRGI
jgi:hypothetical protein